MAPRVGFEPTTIRLTVECSTAELSRNMDRRIASLAGIANPEYRACRKIWAGSAPGIPVVTQTGAVLVFWFTKGEIGPGTRDDLRNTRLQNAPRHCYTLFNRDWPRGGMVTQRTANPCIPVRFWARPPISEISGYSPKVARGKACFSSSSAALGGRRNSAPGLFHE